MTHGAPKAVVFDLGKVVFDFDYGILARRMAPKSRLDEAGIRAVVDQGPLLHRYETGLMDEAEFHAAVVSQTGYSGDREEFERWFGDIFTPIPEMVALQANLAARGIPTFVFSNTNALAIRHIRKSFPFYAGFQMEILSYEVRSMKPSPGIYEALERRSGLKGSELLYLDDRPENVEAGLGRGWRAWVHSDPAQTVPAVLALFG